MPRISSSCVPAACALLAASPAIADVIDVPGEYSTIQAAVTWAHDGDEIVVAPGDYAGPVYFNGKTIVLRSSGGPSVTRILGSGSSSVVVCDDGAGDGTRIEGFKIQGGADDFGGGIRVDEASLEVVDCVISDNGTVAAGGGVSALDATIVLRDCVIRENAGSGGGGLFFGHTPGYPGPSVFVVTGCLFEDNTADAGGGALVSGATEFRVSNCVFRDNSGGLVGGGMALLIQDIVLPKVTNCVFSGNTSEDGAGLYTTLNTVLINCTIADNDGPGFMYGNSANVVIYNTVLWGNSGGAIVADYGNGGGFVSVWLSDVEGGWTGSGTANIDADPLFLNPTDRDYRLAVGSPCLDTGYTGALPDDLDDLDGDGDTAELIPIDLAGGPRVIGPYVDIGAYEGGEEPGVPLMSEDDLDGGEAVMLVPTGGSGVPEEETTALVLNTSGPDDATATASELPTPGGPQQGYFSVASVLRLETSLGDGQFFSRVTVPFTADDLGAHVPFEIDLVSATDPVDWSLAVDNNTVGGAGTRVEVTGPAPYGFTNQLGDHGVYWDPTLEAGFAWANVDFAADFAAGLVDLCPADITGDGVVDVLDLVEVVLAIGSADPDADLDGSGVVDVMDIVAAIVAWGPC